MRLPAFLFAAALAFSGNAALAQAPTGKITVVAAQNFYGDIARQIADAQIVIANGAHYDEWVDKLLKTAPRPGRTVISAARLVKARHGDNPHLWYNPATMPAVAKAIAAALSKADSDHAAAYSERLAKTLTNLDRVAQRVAEMRARHAGKPVAATEPVFGLMADALGLTMRNQKFQRALMNETEPSARDIAAFESDLKNQKVAVLIYNKQVSEKLAERLLTIARTAKVPVVPVTETQPADVSFEDWMLGQLDALDKALTGAKT